MQSTKNKTTKRKCIFLDRDGVINKETGDYIYKLKDFIIQDGVVQALLYLKKKNYLLIVVTNQGGLAEGFYTRKQMNTLHEHLQILCNFSIDDFYYSPYRSVFSASLVHKPGTLLFEKAIAKYNIDTSVSWVVGDTERDILAGKKMGLKTILISDEKKFNADYYARNLLESVKLIF